MYVQEFLPELLESVSPLVSLQNPLRRCAARISCGLGWVTATAVTHPTPHILCAPRSGARGSEEILIAEFSALYATISLTNQITKKERKREL